MAKQRKPLKIPRLTGKEVKLIKALVAGKSNGEAGMLATGSSSLASGATQAGRMLKSDDLQDALAKAFEENDITFDAAIAPIGKALKAKRIVQTKMGNLFTTDLDDVDLQLKGSDRALKLMGIGQNSDGGVTNNFIFIAKEQRAKYDIS